MSNLLTASITLIAGYMGITIPNGTALPAMAVIIVAAIVSHFHNSNLISEIESAFEGTANSSPQTSSNSSKVTPSSTQSSVPVAVTPSVPAPQTTPAPSSATATAASSWIQNANGTYTNTVTGRTYATLALGYSIEATIAAAQASTAGTPHTVVTPNGQQFSTTYSQYWMDPTYNTAIYGTPSAAVKAAYSDATYAFAIAQYTIGATTTAPAVPTTS